MNIFNRNFGSSKKEEIEIKIQKDNNEIAFPKWDFKIMFLRALNKTSLSNIGEYQLNIYKTLLGDLEVIISEFINLGYIKIPTFIDCLDNAMTVKQLNVFLKTKGVKSTGNKNELMLRANGLFSTDERKRIEENGFMYVVTSYGWEIVNSDKERFKSELTSFENLVVNELLRDECENACKYVSHFYSTYPFPIGMGMDWEKGFSENDKAIVNYILRSNYLTQSMVMPEEMNTKIRAIIAADYLLSNSKRFSGVSISDKILFAFPEFKCEQIESFLNNNPTGIFQSYDSKNQADIVYIFNHTIINEAHNKIELERIMKYREDSLFKGILILEGKNNCEYCTNAELKYSWENIKSLPKLPKYPGCICLYLPMTKNN